VAPRAVAAAVGRYLCVGLVAVLAREYYGCPGSTWGGRLNLGDERFRIEAVIGEGGTARVFRARDVRTGQHVAVKVLRDFLLDSEESVARFNLESELLEKFDHPNILPFLGRGKLEDGCPWFASAYAAQGSLADRMLRQGRLGAHELLGYIAEILEALRYLHEQNVIHRDVKPENVLLDENDVAMLCDFGIAKSPTRQATMQGDRMGTPSFMAPEQYTDPRSVTPQADLFGAGVTLFVGLTGQTGMVLLVDHLRQEALASLPPAIAPIVDKATSLKVEGRYRTAWEMSLDVADVLE
jgi:eukaryotic-like serine/threonine-protein kinase